MSAVRHVVIPAIATVALVLGAIWLAHNAMPRPDIPNEAAIRKASAPKPKGVRLRCDPEELVSDALPGSEERRLEAEFYRAIIATSPHPEDPSQLVVEQVSIPIPRVPRPEHFEDWSSAALALIAQGFFRCTELSVDRFPATAHLAPVAEIAGDWNRLASRFDGARLWFAFSRARVNEATGDAVVYYERVCRDGCGTGEWVWFRRDAAPWRIVGRHWGWIE